jgi:prepilin-type N-terminal cleavage/methylation domain-containing protein
MRNIKNQKGFTLIELLIVIAIIGILASIVLVSLSSARQKARTSTKQAELKQILTAVQVYHSNTGLSPVNATPGSWCQIASGGCLQELITSGTISALPVSPDSGVYYYYDYGAYFLVASRMNPLVYGPGTQGWHCSDAAGGAGDEIYCIEATK